LMGLKSSPSSTAMAELTITISNLLRSTKDSGEVFAVVMGSNGDSALLDDNNACSRLLSKVEGRVVLLCVCDGGFMVVVELGF
jgi:hypothetical protein